MKKIDSGLITLIFLILAIFIGYKKKINTGFIGILFAFILGKFSLKLSDTDIIKGWPTTLFFILFGMTFLFSIAKVNGTLELVSKKLCLLAKGNTKLIPIIFFIMCGIISALGPGPIAVTALMAPIAMELSRTENIPELLMSTMTISGSLAGGLSPLSPSGIIANSLAKDQGLNTAKTIFLGTFVVMTILGVIFYVLFGGYKLKRKVVKEVKSIELNSNQKKTIIVFLLVIIGIFIYKLNIGLIAFSGATLLLLLGVADEDKAILGIPWTTLILVSGVAVLVNVVNIAGGIDMLSTILVLIMTRKTASGMLAITSGLMSAVSSASGVVMPTLIPTIPNIASQVGASPYSLMTGLVVGAHMVTFSPLSTLGALTLASTINKTNKQKLFTQFLIIGFISVIFAGILGFLGLYDLF